MPSSFTVEPTRLRWLLKFEELDSEMENSQGAWVTLVDGTMVDFSWPRASQFKPKNLGAIKILGVKLSSADAPAFQQFINQKMPALEQLSVTTDLDMPKTRGVLAPPVYAFAPANFPKLTRLKVDSAFVDLPAALCGQLEVLHLTMSCISERRFPLASVQGILGHAAKLRELLLERYVDVTPPPRNAAPLQVQRIEGALETIHIRDEPEIVSKFLSYFRTTSPKLYIEATGFIDEDLDPVVGLRALLPGDKQNYPALRAPKILRVFDTMDHQTLLSTQDSSHEQNGFDFVLHPDLLPVWSLQGRRSGKLFASMVRCLGLFPGSSVQGLHLAGIMQAIPLEIWRATFAHCPGVQHLELEDSSPCSNHNLGALFAALTERAAGGSGRLACDQLRQLRISSHIPSLDQSFLADLMRCVQTRMKSGGCARLEKLTLRLIPELPRSEEGARRWKQILAPLARSVELEIISPSTYLRADLLLDAEDN
ncbi:hypothetical protein C8Q77DRAFT_1160741 [Trametes polyzona]|nr:hypothetical protein C8Q77DRAFT_1160741 [Trametes polyzona]